MEELRFEGMSDDRVLERCELLVAQSNRLTAELLAYLAEVERRALHLREATGSLFAFCVERLHMSEGAAGKRITAARTARRFPLILEMVACGEIHLTGVNLLGPHLTEENHRELLARTGHRSKREIEKLVAEIAPRPDAPSRVAALPRSVVLADPVEVRAQEVHAPGRVASAERVAPSPERVAPVTVRAPTAVVQLLSPRRYQIRVTVGEEAHAALCQLQDLLSHQLHGSEKSCSSSRAEEPCHGWRALPVRASAGRTRWGSPTGGSRSAPAARGRRPRSGRMPTEGSAHVRDEGAPPGAPFGERKRAPPEETSTASRPASERLAASRGQATRRLARLASVRESGRAAGRRGRGSRRTCRGPARARPR